MQTSLNYNSIRSVTSATSDMHALSLQDTLEQGKAISFVGKALEDEVAKIYRPTIGFFRNTYLVDDFGFVVKVTAKQFPKVIHCLTA